MENMVKVKSSSCPLSLLTNQTEFSRVRVISFKRREAVHPHKEKKKIYIYIYIYDIFLYDNSYYFYIYHHLK